MVRCLLLVVVLVVALVVCFWVLDCGDGSGSKSCGGRITHCGPAGGGSAPLNGIFDRFHLLLLRLLLVTRAALLAPGKGGAPLGSVFRLAPLCIFLNVPLGIRALLRPCTGGEDAPVVEEELRYSEPWGPV